MTSSSSHDQGGQGAMPLAIVALATMLALVVFTAPLTTLAAMSAELSLGPAGQAWVMSAMPLGAASGLLAAGALGDTLGRRRIFVAGLVLSVATSIIAAIAPSGWVLIVMRIGQGLGSAGIMACGLGLLGQIYRGDALKRAAAVWAAALGAGVAAGPVAASLLLDLGGWRAIHWLIAGVSALLALAAQRRLPETTPLKQPVDTLGAITLMIGMAALMATLIELRVGTPGLVATLLIVAALFLVAFVALERRNDNPILDLRLFANTGFVAATIAAFASGAGILALMSMAPTILVQGLNLSPLTAALVTLAWSGVTVVSALYGARLLPAGMSAQARVITAMLGCALGQALMALAHLGSGWLVVLPGLFLSGVFNGMLNASLGHAALLHVPESRSAMGSAANNTARYLGSALGISLISIVIAQAQGAALFTGWHVAVIGTTLVSLLGAGTMVALNRRPA